MHISATPASPAAAANCRPRPNARATEASASVAPPTPGPVTVPATPETDPVEQQPHGLVGGTGDSHRSSVAALRQWINHPERRAEMGTPDLTATPHGKGFEKAVAAYQAAIATTPPVTDPVPTTPPVTDPAPTTPPVSTTEPVPVEGG